MMKSRKKTLAIDSKISPLLDIMNDILEEQFTVGEELVIDESIVSTGVDFTSDNIFPANVIDMGQRYETFKMCSVNGYTHRVKIYIGSRYRGRKMSAKLMKT